jgi:replicative DNA helicase
MDYMKRIIPDEVMPYFEDAESQVRVASKNLHVKYKKKDYTINDLASDIGEICFKANLIIIDHLQYFDYDSSKENSEITKIVKRIRDLTLNSEVPIILISHLRKNYSLNAKPIPSIDDIFGTSNIQKVASKVIIISPDFQNKAESNEKFSTLFRVVKNRYYGSVERFVGILSYDSMKNNYSREYFLGRLNFNEDEYKIVQEGELPLWCETLRSRRRLI